MQTKAPVISVDTGILLEAGTNEVEVLVFQADGQRFGVNVAKVREVLEIGNITQVPKSHPAIEGAVRIRNWVVPIINLARYLDPSAQPELTKTDRLLLLEFNNEKLGFRVNSVERIYRVSWRDTIPLPAHFGTTAPVVSIIKIQDKLVPMLDFEAIGAKISSNGTTDRVKIDTHAKNSSIFSQPIVIADDSAMIRCKLNDTLTEAGFTRVLDFTDGDAAWSYLEDLAKQYKDEPGKISTQVRAIVSDVEMPRLDGLSLTRRIRENAALKSIPVILFSSLVSSDNEKKGEQVGATAQVAKPKYQALVDKLCEVLEAGG